MMPEPTIVLIGRERSRAAFSQSLPTGIPARDTFHAAKKISRETLSREYLKLQTVLTFSKSLSAKASRPMTSRKSF
jgi:hypothetical protein